MACTEYGAQVRKGGKKEKLRRCLTFAAFCAAGIRIIMAGGFERGQLPVTFLFFFSFFSFLFLYIFFWVRSPHQSCRSRGWLGCLCWFLDLFALRGWDHKPRNAVRARWKRRGGKNKRKKQEKRKEKVSHRKSISCIPEHSKERHHHNPCPLGSTEDLSHQSGSAGGISVTAVSASVRCVNPPYLRKSQCWIALEIPCPFGLHASFVTGCSCLGYTR
ncbi:hypothetical protein V8C35DRAFT_25835 [Trichoderma chlorosporum]